MHYEMRLISTSSGIGYFSCHPMEVMEIDDELSYLRSHPNDEFMHKHLLDRVCECDESVMQQLLQEARTDPEFQAILYEAILTHEKFENLRNFLDKASVARLSVCSPLIYIKSSILEDQPIHRQWIEVFRENIFEHKTVDSSRLSKIPSPYPDEQILSSVRRVDVKQVEHDMFSATPIENPSIPSAEETSRNALAKLQAIGLPVGDEIRHSSSLSPYGFYRKWQFAVSVRSGRHDFSLKGIQTSYGKGLQEEDARASYAMEMVERYSSFASFDGLRAIAFTKDFPLTFARYEELKEREVLALDPNSLNLEVPYDNSPLYWLEGTQVEGLDLRPILIPAQAVFLFSNLDEISLFSGLGSTGLASGNTVEQAKVSALLEVIERDGQAVSFFDTSRCFKLAAEDSILAPLLKDYSKRGIDLQFQDMSQEFGLPCYKCFVVGPQGQIIAGTGAHLDGKKALISAMTETPYPYPHGPQSIPAPKEIPIVQFEDLPDYRTGNLINDLVLLEKVLNVNGFRPIYVELTRADLGIPVVKALIPGLELMADFDRFSRISLRMFRNFCNYIK